MTDAVERLLRVMHGECWHLETAETWDFWMHPAGSEQADILITTKFHDRCENFFGSRGQRVEDVYTTQ